MLSASMYDLSPTGSAGATPACGSTAHRPHSSIGSSLFLGGQAAPLRSPRPVTPPPPSAEQLVVPQPRPSTDYTSHTLPTLAGAPPPAQLGLAIKSEPSSNGMFSNYDFMNNTWLSSLNSQVNALASLKALMQANKTGGNVPTSSELLSARLAAAAAAAAAANANAPLSASPSTAASIGNDEDCRPQSSAGLDVASTAGKFPVDYVSDAIACTSAGGTTSTVADAIPRKQDIQTDIRMNKGRFQLVRKRGRSEVWNLFGQVVDTLTGNRLPYVACYACKVLYTFQDTGGGTGNMTRHRCSMGNSYRTLTGSSTASDSTADKSAHHANNTSTCSEPAVPPLSLPSSSSSYAQPIMANRGSSLESMPSFDAPAITPTQMVGSSLQHLVELTVSTISTTASSVAAAAVAAAAFNASAAREAFVQSGNNSGGSGGTASSGFISASVGSVGSHSFLHSADSLTGGQTAVSPFLLHQMRQQQAVAYVAQQSNLNNLLAANSALAQMGRSLGALPTLAAAGGQASRSSTASGAISPLPSSDFAPTGLFALSQTSSTSLTPSQSQLSNSRRLNAADASSTVLGTGYMFTAADKQLFSNAVLQFCARDLHNYDVVEGEGFRNLIETALFIGRRSHGDAATTSPKFDPVRNLIPTAHQMRHMMNVQDGYVRQATLADLSAAKSMGVALSVQSVRYAGGYYLAVFADYVTDDWRLTQRCLGVHACVNGAADAGAGELIEFVAELLIDCNLEGSRSVLLAVDTLLDLHHARLAVDARQLLPDRLLVVRSAKRALNQILHDALAVCETTARDAIAALVNVCRRVMRALSTNDAVADALPQAAVACAFDNQSDVLPDYVDTIYAIIKWVGDHLAQVRAVLARDGLTQLFADLDQLNWTLAREFLTFLQSFYETAQIFKHSKNPHAQKMLPEWHALIHECDELAGGSPSAAARSDFADSDAGGSASADVFELRRSATAHVPPRHSHSTLSSSSGASEDRASRGSAIDDAVDETAVGASLDRAARIGRFSLRSGISIEMSGLFRSKSRSVTPKWDEDETGGVDAATTLGPAGSIAACRRPYLRDVHMSSIMSADGVDDDEENNKDNVNNNNNNSNENDNENVNENSDQSENIQVDVEKQDEGDTLMQVVTSKSEDPSTERDVIPVESLSGVKNEQPDENREEDVESKLSMVDSSDWLRRARRVANAKLQAWARDHILLEQKIATVLNPRLRHLNVICSHSERLAVYARIREMTGLKDSKRCRQSSEANTEEPARKRREFLDRLEDCAAEEDELDVYLRAAFPSNLTRDVLEFWSSLGDAEFPRLARLARFLLAIKGAIEPLTLTPPSTPLNAQDLSTLFILKPDVLDSLNRSPSAR